MASNPAARPGGAPRRLSGAWPAFADRLAAVLAHLEEDQFLVISVKGSNRFVQFAGQGAFGLRAETVSNSYLNDSEQLDAQQIDSLVQAGWHAPTGAPGESRPENDPDGSPNFFRDYPAPVPFEAAAQLAVRTLAQVLRVPHPGFLQYEAFDRDGHAVSLAGLGLKCAARAAEPPAALPQSLLAAVREATGLVDLQFDGDGDIGLHFGSLTVFIRLIGDPPYVRIYSSLVRDVAKTPKLLARLNEINAGIRHVRFFAGERAIFAVADLPATPFVAEHVAQALVAFCRITDGLDELLEADFGGGAIPGAPAPSKLRH